MWRPLWFGPLCVRCPLVLHTEFVPKFEQAYGCKLLHIALAIGLSRTAQLFDEERLKKCIRKMKGIHKDSLALRPMRLAKNADLLGGCTTGCTRLLLDIKRKPARLESFVTMLQAVDRFGANLLSVPVGAALEKARRGPSYPKLASAAAAKSRPADTRHASPHRAEEQCVDGKLLCTLSVAAEPLPPCPVVPSVAPAPASSLACRSLEETLDALRQRMAMLELAVGHADSKQAASDTAGINEAALNVERALHGLCSVVSASPTDADAAPADAQARGGHLATGTASRSQESVLHSPLATKYPASATTTTPSVVHAQDASSTEKKRDTDLSKAGTAESDRTRPAAPIGSRRSEMGRGHRALLGEFDQAFGGSPFNQRLSFGEFDQAFGGSPFNQRLSFGSPNNRLHPEPAAEPGVVEMECASLSGCPTNGPAGSQLLGDKQFELCDGSTGMWSPHQPTQARPSQACGLGDTADDQPGAPRVGGLEEVACVSAPPCKPGSSGAAAVPSEPSAASPAHAAAAVFSTASDHDQVLALPCRMPTSALDPLSPVFAPAAGTAASIAACQESSVSAWQRAAVGTRRSKCFLGCTHDLCDAWLADFEPAVSAVDLPAYGWLVRTDGALPHDGVAYEDEQPQGSMAMGIPCAVEALGGPLLPADPEDTSGGSSTPAGTWLPPDCSRRPSPDAQASLDASLDQVEHDEPLLPEDAASLLPIRSFIDSLLADGVAEAPLAAAGVRAAVHGAVGLAKPAPRPCAAFDLLPGADHLIWCRRAAERTAFEPSGACESMLPWILQELSLPSSAPPPSSWQPSQPPQAPLAALCPPYRPQAPPPLQAPPACLYSMGPPPPPLYLWPPPHPPPLHHLHPPPPPHAIPMAPPSPFSPHRPAPPPPYHPPPPGHPCHPPPPGCMPPGRAGPLRPSTLHRYPLPTSLPPPPPMYVPCSAPPPTSLAYAPNHCYLPPPPITPFSATM